MIGAGCSGIRKTRYEYLTNILFGMNGVFCTQSNDSEFRGFSIYMALKGRSYIRKLIGRLLRSHVGFFMGQILFVRKWIRLTYLVDKDILKVLIFRGLILVSNAAESA